MHHLTAVAIKWSCIQAINCCYGQLPMAEFITKVMYFYEAVDAVLRYLLPRRLVGYSRWAARRSASRAASRLALLLENPAAPFFVPVRRLRSLLPKTRPP
jgi:hypothetical protein